MYYCLLYMCYITLNIYILTANVANVETFNITLFIFGVKMFMCSVNASQSFTSLL